MNSLIVKHILFLILIRIPLSVFPALPAKDAESHKTALMSLYIQAKQNPKVTLPRLDSLEKQKPIQRSILTFSVRVPIMHFPNITWLCITPSAWYSIRIAGVIPCS